MAAAGISYYKTGIYVGVIGGNILGDSEAATIAIVDPRVLLIIPESILQKQKPKSL